MADQLATTRHSLLLRLKQHDGVAWQEFLNVYETAIVRYCCSRGLQHADARDATQEVLAAVYRRIGNWDCDKNGGSLRAWMFRVARNVAVDALRKRGRRDTASGDTRVRDLLAELPAEDDAVATAIQLEYRRALFQWAAEQVRPEVRKKTWQSFWMTAVDGQSPEQVAKALGISVGSVYTAKCRVVARMRTKIAHVDANESHTDRIISIQQ